MDLQDIIIFLLVLLFLILVFSRRSEVIGQWNHVFPDMQHDPEEFYTLVEAYLKEWEIPNYQIDRKNFLQGNIFSSRRVYLEVARGDYIYHICAAPFGNGFFFSWWLREVSSFLHRFNIKTVKSGSYYKADTNAVFRACVQQGVITAVDKITEAKGIRGLTESERIPDLRSVFAKK